MQLQKINKRIFEFRGLKVMLDFDLAELYEVDTKALKQAVKRNRKRFPVDFMFKLTKKEFETLRSQIVTSKRGGVRYAPFAFTEQGVAMLAGILKSKKAIDVNIGIMRAFVMLRQFALSHKDLTEKLRILERKYNRRFKDFEEVLKYLVQKDILEKEQIGRRRIGYK